MGKSVTISSILLVIFFISSCQKIETRKEKYDSGKLKKRWEVTVSKEGEQKNGLYEEFHENGKLKCVINYVDDKEHGLYHGYHKNGKMEAEIHYLEGLMHGEYKTWYDNGKKKRFANYKDGSLHGTLKLWDSKGKKVAKAKFKNGICKNGDCDQVNTAAPTRL